MGGIRPEQGPPLVVPMAFFLAAPLSVCTAGAVLLARGDDAMTTVYGTTQVAVVHLGVVGFLMFAMVGALYQMLPVVAGAVVPRPRLGHVVHALMVCGAGALVTGQATGEGAAFVVAVVALSLALVLFLGPAGWAALTSDGRGPTAWGMKLALLALATVAYAGLRMAYARAGGSMTSEWLGLRWAHAHVGFLGWVGGLVAAVSWQVLPMFFLAPAPPFWLPWVVLGSTGLTLCALASVIAFGLPALVVPWLALPGAVAVWLVQPAWTLWALRHRARRRRDATTWYWWLSATAAPACLAAGVVVAGWDEPRATLVYGMLVLWAWAGTLVHGMLCRIVPFLVWLHRCAPRVGLGGPVPSARDLLTDRQAAAGFLLHGVTLAAGLWAALDVGALPWRVLGAGLLATGAHLEWTLVAAWRRGRG